MHETRTRGKQGKDDILFGETPAQEDIKAAIKDLHYLLTKGYAMKSSLQLVGNRYRLNVRQQRAAQGMSASAQQLQHRISTHTDPTQKQKIAIDGFNLIILLESALSEAYIFKGLDNCYRDLSGVHGTYKRIQHTQQAIMLVAAIFPKNEILWVLDKPVSNSGKLKSVIYEIATQKQLKWEVILENNPDKYLADLSDSIIISSDAWILDHCQQWYNLGSKIVEDCLEIEDVNIILA